MIATAWNVTISVLAAAYLEPDIGINGSPLCTRRSMMTYLVLAVFFGSIPGAFPPTGPALERLPPDSTGPIVVDDFEDDKPGTFPEDWVYVTSDQEIRSYDEISDDGEKVVVREKDGNNFIRLTTNGEALRYTKRNGVDFDWNLKDHPRLKWRWRAHKLPKGASEKDQNDVGAAVYVTFGSDWLGRPKSIKYTYSSSLPVGTTVSYGPLKVIVVDSAREPRLGEWKTHQRRVRDDYQQVFGESAPDRPVSITLWSDSDTVNGESEVDVDDIELLPSNR